MLTRTQARKSGLVEIVQPVDGPVGDVPPVRPPLEAVGKPESSPAEPAGPAPVPATSRVIPTDEDGFGGGPESFPPAGFPLRCPGGQTGPKQSIEEIPRPPSEQGTSSLPGLATDNIGYQTASSVGRRRGGHRLSRKVHRGPQAPRPHSSSSHGSRIFKPTTSKSKFAAAARVAARGTDGCRSRSYTRCIALCDGGGAAVTVASNY